MSFPDSWCYWKLLCAIRERTRFLLIPNNMVVVCTIKHVSLGESDNHFFDRLYQLRKLRKNILSHVNTHVRKSECVPIKCYVFWYLHQAEKLVSVFHFAGTEKCPTPFSSVFPEFRVSFANSSFRLHLATCSNFLLAFRVLSKVISAITPALTPLVPVLIVSLRCFPERIKDTLVYAEIAEISTKMLMGWPRDTFSGLVSWSNGITFSEVYASLNR